MIEGCRLIGPRPEHITGRAAGIIAQDAAGRWLMQLRDDIAGIHRPGEWGLFGGGVEAGECGQEAAAREFHEETGLKFAPEAFAPHVAVYSSQGLAVLVFVLTHRVAPDQIRLAEGAGFGFFTARQLGELATIDYLRPVMRAISAPCD